MESNTTSTYRDENVLPIIETVDFNSFIPKAAPSPHPVYSADRIQTIDMIRGFALLGILMMNIPLFGGDFKSFYDVITGTQNSTDFRTIMVIESFFGGTMRALFSMLFGAGMILFTMNKKEIAGGVTVTEYYYRRLLWLVFFGVVNAYVLLWFGDILYAYGLCGMLLYPFRKTAVKWLLVLGFACIGIGLFKGMLQWSEMKEKRAKFVEAKAVEKTHKKLTPEQQGAIAAWESFEKENKPDTFRVNKSREKMHGGYLSVFDNLLQRNGNIESWGMYHGLWDMMAMMFIGMALFFLGFFTNKLSTSTYTMLLLLGYGLGIPIGYIFFKGEVTAISSIGTYLDMWRVPPDALYDCRRLLLAVGHASLLLLIYRSGVISWLMKALANVGQMAFTNYLMQSIICTIIFNGYGFDYYARMPYHRLYFVVAGVWIFQLVFSVIWLRYYRFGPFEWVWRSLTYWKKQPMKIKVQEVA